LVERSLFLHERSAMEESSADASLPDWVLLLEAVRARMKAAAEVEPADQGFKHLLTPFVEYAIEELVGRDLPGWQLLEDTAVHDLEQSLASRLTRIARDTLMYEFSVWKAVAGPRRFGCSFVREHLRDGCAKLFDAYPVLARLLAERAQQWIEFVGLFLERLHNDRLGAIAHVDPKMGDSHRGGQTVVCVQLVSGERFLYKPKPLDGDREFAKVVSWLNGRSSIALRCVPTTYRPDYGWQQYIEVMPCTDRKAVHEYFRRAGMLLCLMYVFGGSDCHRQNIIAHGEFPMMVDVETFLSPDSFDSVQRTAMLPALESRHVYRDGTFQYAGDFVEDVVRGFSEAYGVLAANRPAVLHERDVRLRYVYRDTRTYSAVLANALRASALRTGMDFSIQLDGLARVMPHWQILRAEHEALSRGDIPVFQYTAGRTDLCFESGTSIPEYFRQSGLDALRQRVEQLGPRDLDVQIAHIRGAFQRESDELLQEAVAIGEGVVASTRKLQLSAMGLRLYDGLAGPALFLAALWSVTGEQRFRKTALDTAELILQGLRLKNRSELNCLGAGLGVGSISYALAAISEYLGEERFRRHALEASRDIDRSVIDADNSLDVLSGSAGYILAVSALSKRGIKDDCLLRNAVHCGEHLLKCPMPVGSGFAHGSAGIAYALTRLFSLTADRGYLDAALEACQGSLPATQMRWCDGAPGIGLARLGMRVGDAPFIRADIERALKITASAPIDKVDHVCCGNFGRVDLLLTAAQKLDESAWRNKAVELASSVIQRARTSGHYAMGSRQYSCSFHQGMAGIGYQLLRLARPAQFPSVLLWE